MRPPIHGMIVLLACLAGVLRSVGYCVTSVVWIHRLHAPICIQCRTGWLNNPMACCHNSLELQVLACKTLAVFSVSYTLERLQTMDTHKRLACDHCVRMGGFLRKPPMAPNGNLDFLIMWFAGCSCVWRFKFHCASTVKHTHT